MMSLALCISLLGVARGQSVSLQMCSNPIVDAQLFEYSDMAFIQHVSSGLALEALGDPNTSTTVGLTTTPQLFRAQFIFHNADKEITIFPTTPRCLTASHDCSTAEVAACNTHDSRQLFHTFFPDFDPHTRKHNQVRFQCGAKNGSRCMTLSPARQAESMAQSESTATSFSLHRGSHACRVPNPYFGKTLRGFSFNSSVMRSEFDFLSLAPHILNWTDPQYGYEWWQARICSNLTVPSPPPSLKGAVSCANEFSPLPASAVSGEIEVDGDCNTNAVWDDGTANYSFRIFFDEECGVSVAFDNGGIDPTYNKRRSTEYLLRCNPASLVPNIIDVEQPTKCHYTLTIDTAAACPYLPGVKGVPIGKPGCPPFAPLQAQGPVQER